MAEKLKEYFNQLRELMEKLDTKAKVIIGIVTGIVLIALLFLIFSGTSHDYQPLFQQLSSEDANAIVEELEARGVNYRLADGGRTIMVPSDVVHNMRLQMAGEGLPQQGLVGFEIFDSTDFGTTDFERRVNLYRAMGGELSRSIQNMNTVEFARVQITAPEQSLFIDEESPAKASVMLQLEAGTRLTNSQSRAIGNLVASSVPDLSPENVTIVDTAGNLLTPDFNDDDFSTREMTSNQRETERGYEEELKRRLRTMLTRILGPDNFTVQVAARMNFDQRERESVTYLPVVDDEGIPRSTEELREVYYGGAEGEGGVPGTESNIPGYAELNDSEDDYYQRTDSVTNYEVNEVVEREVFAPGDLERLSVSVMVDDEMEEEDLMILENAIQTSVDFDEDRGDTVNVSSLAFDNSLEEEMTQAREAEAEAERQRQLLYVGLIVGIIILTLITIFILNRKAKKKEEVAVQGRQVDMTVGDSEEEDI
ncbi:MAG: flagellar basal-body MS-ring/collar protein FliF, partial [Halarsenatibacteraceae bacterium]